MHVERERRGGVARRELDGDAAVGLEAGAQAAVALRDAEPEKARGAQVRVVVERERGLAIVRRGARREAFAREAPRRGEEVLHGRDSKLLAAMAPRTDRLLLTNAMLGQFISGFGARSFVIGLPTIASALGADILGISWAIIAYQLAGISLAVVFGRLGDIHGRYVIYGSGFAIMAVSSILCGIAPNVSWLIAFRVIAGIGAAMLASATRVLAMEAMPEHAAGRANGFMTMSFHGGMLLGPPVGGLVIEALSWRRAVFRPHHRHDRTARAHVARSAGHDGGVRGRHAPARGLALDALGALDGVHGDRPGILQHRKPDRGADIGAARLSRVRDGDGADGLRTRRAARHGTRDGATDRDVSLRVGAARRRRHRRRSGVVRLRAQRDVCRVPRDHLARAWRVVLARRRPSRRRAALISAPAPSARTCCRTGSRAPSSCPRGRRRTRAWSR